MPRVDFSMHRAGPAHIPAAQSPCAPDPTPSPSPPQETTAPPLTSACSSLSVPSVPSLLRSPGASSLFVLLRPDLAGSGSRVLLTWLQTCGPGHLFIPQELTRSLGVGRSGHRCPASLSAQLPCQTPWLCPLSASSPSLPTPWGRSHPLASTPAWHLNLSFTSFSSVPLPLPVVQAAVTGTPSSLFSSLLVSLLATLAASKPQHPFIMRGPEASF